MFGLQNSHKQFGIFGFDGTDFVNTNGSELSLNKLNATGSFFTGICVIFVRTNTVVTHFLKHPGQAFAYKFLFYKKLYLPFSSLQFF